MQISGVNNSQWAIQGAGQQHRHGPDPQQLADALGVSTDELRQSAQSGQSLADLAKSKGISSDKLLDAVKSSIKSAGAADGRPELSDDQLTTMATNMINRTPGTGGPPPGPPPDGASASGSVSGSGSAMSLQQLQDLMKSISDGDSDDQATQFSNLLSKLGGGGASAYASASVGLNRLA